MLPCIDPLARLLRRSWTHFAFCAALKLPLDPEAFVCVHEAVCFVCTSPACVGVTNTIPYFQGLQRLRRRMVVTKARCLLNTSGRYCILFFYHNSPRCSPTPYFSHSQRLKRPFHLLQSHSLLSAGVYFELKFEANGSVMQQKTGLSCHKSSHWLALPLPTGSLMNSLFLAQCVVIRTCPPDPSPATATRLKRIVWQKKKFKFHSSATQGF